MFKCCSCLTVSVLCVCVGEDTLVHVSQDALPGDAFALSLNKVWEVIKSQKDLNLPAHKVLRLSYSSDTRQM